MGKITKFTLVKEESQLRELKTGPISILMGRNLRKVDQEKVEPKKKQRGFGGGRVGHGQCFLKNLVS